MRAERPLEMCQTLLRFFRERGETSSDPRSRLAQLEGMIEAFERLPRGVLDRVARVVVRENPACDAVLRKFSSHTQHRDDGIGDILAVACAVVSDDDVREEMCSLYTTTVALALKERERGNFDYDGLGRIASGMIPSRGLAAA